MAGHSKWANIRHQKAKQDAKRGRLFTKLIRELTVAALKGADPNVNPQLRTAMDKALSCNMSRETIDRAIRRGSHGLEGQQLEALRYEGYGPDGVAVMVDCLTNNRRRTVSEVRHAFAKHDGRLETSGAASYLFEHRGLILLSPQQAALELEILEVALRAGAEEVEFSAEGESEIQTTPSAFESVREAVAERWPVSHAELSWRPVRYVTLSAASAEKFSKLCDALEDLEDVQAVYSNAEWDDSSSWT